MTHAVDRVRVDCAWVAARARHVRIDSSRIADYTAMILETYPLIESHDAHHLVTEDAEQTIAYAIALDSINFGSGFFLDVGIEYVDIAGGLKEAFLRGDMNTPSKWVQATPEQLEKIILAPAAKNSACRAELMRAFASHLAQAGEILLRDYGGRCVDFVKAAEGSVARLVDQLQAWPGFQDSIFYDGREIQILKRAQILAADIHLAGFGDFKDMARLTCFADNMIPHVLRCDGILIYAEALAQKIDAQIPLDAGSVEEAELRACGVQAVELMRDAAVAAGRAVTAVNIDHILWNRGYLDPAIHARPPHRVLTDKY